MSESAQQREPLLWLAAATNTKSLDSLPTDFPIIDLTPRGVRGGPLDLDAHMDLDGLNTPHSANSETHPQYETLEAQLEHYTNYKSTTTLHIEGDAPSAAQFSLISSFFPLVKRLYIQTGVFERWKNEGFPAHTTWPLELLVISDACGEYITAEPIVKGLISHLVFYLTHSLQFEGAPDGSNTDPEDILQWLVNTLTGLPFYEDPKQGHGNLEAERIGITRTSRLKKLEILENDAIETFVRFIVAHFETVKTIEELRIRSLGGTDMIYVPAGILAAVLPHLENLKHLDLSLCHHIYFLGTERADKTSQQHWLIDGLSPSLETFYFRGPVSIGFIDDNGKSEWLAQWSDAFGRPDYLPHLKRVGFWLDQPGDFGYKGDPGMDDMDFTDEGNVPTVTKEEIQTAATRVKEFLGPVLRKRGVELVDWEVDGEWRDPWFDEDWLNDGMDHTD